MRIKWLIIFLFFLLPIMGQVPGPLYRVHFSDKEGTPYSLDEVEEFLSARTLLRYEKEGVLPTEKDLPVSPLYLQQLKELGCQVICTSKWFNYAIVNLPPECTLKELEALPFVQEVDLRLPASPLKSVHKKWLSTTPLKVTGNSHPYYGVGFDQLAVENGPALHEKGFKGEGMVIAVLDGGFEKVNTLSAFRKLWDDGRLLGYWNMSGSREDLFTGGRHGTKVLSLLAAHNPGELVGAAPMASYYLFKTEVETFEYPIEEDYWIAAIEKADSLGVDIVTSSLGYYTFDDASFNHSYQELDGYSITISQAASIAAKKGILVFNSAGNTGTKSWHYPIAPSDGNQVISIGAVDVDRNPAPFSAYGPTVDGRICPALGAVGVNTWMVLDEGAMGTGSGTSYATPIVAGLTACLWQGVRAKRSQEIRQMLIKSGSKSEAPDDRVGYGVPDFLQAYHSLQVTGGISDSNPSLLLYPNPASSRFFVKGIPIGSYESAIFDIFGHNVHQETFSVNGGEPVIYNIRFLASGIYLLRLTCKEKVITFPFHKVGK